MLKITDREYTGHEHFAEFDIIHMNGRLYDPLQRRFLNADENIQDPYNTQCYNKYGYVTNNPLLYNDPSGEAFGLGESLVAAIIVGAVIGTASYVIAAIVSGDYGSINLSGVLKSAFWGAVSGAVTFGIGNCFTASATAANSVVASGMQNARFLLQAAVHGVAQGTLAMVQSGGSGFFSGASAGFFGSMGATAWSAGVGGKFASSGVGTIAFGALSGGVGAELAGGNFWQGAVTGGIVAGLNHVMHMESNPDNGYDENGKQINNNGGDTTDYMYDKDGNIISSTSVEFKGAMSQSEFRELGGFRGYGFKGFSMATGAIAEDNTIANIFVGASAIKGIGAGFSYLGKGANALKVPIFRSIGQAIRIYAPKLGANRYLRIGTSTSRGNEVFRITWGNNSKHLLDINLGKIPNLKNKP